MSLGKIYQKIVLLSPRIEVAIRCLYWNNVKHLMRFRQSSTEAVSKKENIKSDFGKILQFLAKNGIKQDDIIVLHSSYASVANSGLSAEEIIDNLLGLVGPEGTLAMPAIRHFPEEGEGDEYLLNYISDKCGEKETVYDMYKSTVSSGLLPFTLMRYDDAEISRFPLNPLVAVGAKASEMMKSNIDGLKPTAHGPNSAWAFCAKQNAWNVGIGVSIKNGVMLAAGGFSRDIFFRQAQDPRVVPTTDSTNQPGATAGVLIKALGIGAQPVQLCWLQFLPYCNPREKGFGVSVNFTNHACMDLGLVVDRKTGKRFMDEHAGRKIKSDALFKVIGTDENYPIAICDDAIVKAINPSFVKLPLEMGTVKKFDTLEQLADAFGIPKQALLDEVAKFNGYVKANDDKDFHRILTFNKGLDVSKAPFYGIEVSPKIHHTMGGVMINENAEVISANTHKPIPGLYAGGEVAGGVHGASRLGTVAVIDALTFGMIAGENFAKMQ